MVLILLQVKVGPQSSGYRLVSEGLVFGGTTLTSSDIAVAAGLVQMGDPTKVTHLSADVVAATVQEIHNMVETIIDQVKVYTTINCRQELG